MKISQQNKCLSYLTFKSQALNRSNYAVVAHLRAKAGGWAGSAHFLCQSYFSTASARITPVRLLRQGPIWSHNRGEGWWGSLEIQTNSIVVLARTKTDYLTPNFASYYGDARDEIKKWAWYIMNQKKTICTQFWSYSSMQSISQLCHGLFCPRLYFLWCWKVKRYQTLQSVTNDRFNAIFQKEVTP